MSPHLDDAVFACGQWIASSPSSIVATIFAGAPPADAALTTWDAECGFRGGDDVIAARRAEDRVALALLGATPIWLDFRDVAFCDDDTWWTPQSLHCAADVHGSLRRIPRGRRLRSASVPRLRGGAARGRPDECRLEDGVRSAGDRASRSVARPRRRPATPARAAQRAVARPVATPVGRARSTRSWLAGSVRDGELRRNVLDAFRGVAG